MTHLGLRVGIAVLSDGECWINNVGTAMIRVNGVEIGPGKVGKLPNGAVVDFAGMMLLFIENPRLFPLEERQ
jgi:hypothetical protein